MIRQWMLTWYTKRVVKSSSSQTMGVAIRMRTDFLALHAYLFNLCCMSNLPQCRLKIMKDYKHHHYQSRRVSELENTLIEAGLFKASLWCLQCQWSYHFSTFQQKKQKHTTQMLRIQCIFPNKKQHASSDSFAPSLAFAFTLIYYDFTVTWWGKKQKKKEGNLGFGCKHHLWLKTRENPSLKFPGDLSW